MLICTELRRHTKDSLEKWYNTTSEEDIVNGGKIQGALLSGIIAVVIALIITYLVSLVIPTADLNWALIAVGIASFCSGLAGHLSGASQSNR